jgi:[ribosomal protein S5]-alanine N-acetyltransferase
MTTPSLTTNTFLLRAFTDADVASVFKGLSHPQVIKHYGVSFATLEATKEQMAWYKELESQGIGNWFAICSTDDKIFYGAAGLNSLQKEHKKAEIGYWLLPEFWGMGLMKEALPAVCEFGFKQLDLHRIEALIETDNLSSINLISQLNFNHEGTMKDCEIKNGKYLSLAIYALLNSK